MRSNGSQLYLSSSGLNEKLQFSHIGPIKDFCEAGSGNIANGKIDGNTLQWEAIIKIPAPMTSEFNAIVDGDSISGTMAMGRIGKAPFKGMRG